MLPTSHALAALRRRLRLAVRAAIPSVVLLAALSTASSAQTIFVDASNGACSNLGPGTEAQPYCSIGAAMAANKGPGITIVVKPGVYREQLTVGASGAAGTPYVIQGQGPGVVIDGADDFSNAALWTPAAGTTFLASSVVWAAKQVYVDGVRLAASSATPDAMPARTFSFVLGQGLYVNLGGDNPAAHATLVGHRNYGFNVFSKSFVTLSGFEIAHTEDRGINIQTGCTDIVVSNNRVRFANSYGIQTVNGQRITIEGNTVSDCNFHGIGLTAGASGCVVRNNESFRNAHPTIRQANGIYLFGAPGNTITGNRLHHNQDTGLQFNGGSNDCLSSNNCSWSNGDHGFDHLMSTGVRHVNDEAYQNFLDGFSFEGSAPNGQVHNCIASENGEFDLWVDANSSVGFTSDYNLFWNATAQAPVKFVATTYATLGAFQAASGLDPHSKSADPKFANSAAADFRLLAGSPAIDAGSSSASGWSATDVTGAARVDDPLTPNTGEGPVAFGDMGAFEFVPPVVPPVDHAPVVTAPTTVKVNKGQTVTFAVTATDSDGDVIQSLSMVAVKMPVNSGATFTPNATNTGGAFTWAPGRNTGNFQVRFVATNALQGSATSTIQIKTGKARMDGANDPQDPVDHPVVAMSAASPNPSVGEVSFTLDLSEASDVDLGIYDMQGRRVWQGTRSLPAGRASVSWDGLNSGRQRVGTGIYFVRAQVGEAVLVRRVIRF